MSIYNIRSVNSIKDIICINNTINITYTIGTKYIYSVISADDIKYTLCIICIFGVKNTNNT